MKTWLAQVARQTLPFAIARKLGRVYLQTQNLLKYGDRWFPLAIHIETSEYCNRSCWYCSRTERESRRGRITDSMFNLALRRLAEIKWTGPVGYHFENEPLLNPKLVEQLKLTKITLPKCLPTLVTNGDFLTMEKAAELISAGVARLIISRHPPFADDWDSRIAEIKKTWPGVVSMTQVGKTIPVHTNGQLTHTGIEWQGYCVAPSLSMSIRMNGDVSLCGCDIDRKAVFGNIEHATLFQIWNRPAFKDMRHRLRAGERNVHSICHGCSGMI